MKVNKEKKLLQAQVSKDDIKKLDNIAQRADVNRADLVRVIINSFINEFEEKHGVIKLKPRIDLKS